MSKVALNIGEEGFYLVDGIKFLKKVLK